MKFSRTGVHLFMECPHCFYLQYKLKLKRPSGYPFTLNAAHDKLVKAEMDHYREVKSVPPVLKSQNLSLIPYDHKDLGNWRNNRRGVSFEYKGFLFYGAIDDVWLDKDQRVHVVDYKCTAKAVPVTELDEKAEHHNIYKKQVEFYTWLLQNNGVAMSDMAYFYYSTGDNTLPMFNERLEFRTTVIPHHCDLSWIELVLHDLIKTYESTELPDPDDNCQYCNYYQNRLAIKV